MCGDAQAVETTIPKSSFNEDGISIENLKISRSNITSAIAQSVCATTAIVLKVRILLHITRGPV